MIRITRSLVLLLVLRCCIPQALIAAPAAIQSDKTDAYVEALRNHVNRNEYLARLEFAWVWDHPGYVVVVQKPWNMADGYVEKTAKLRVAESLAMHAQFQEGIAKRHNLTTRAKSPRMLILVLEDYETISGYLSAVQRQKIKGLTSAYRARDRMLVLCQTPYTTFAGREVEMRKQERHWRALQIMQAYSARSDRIPGPYWFVEGLAKELAGLHDRDQTRDIYGKSTEWIFNDLCTTMQDPMVGPATLLSLFELLSVENYGDVYDKATDHALAANIKMPSGRRVYEDFQSASGALVQFLSYHSSEELSAAMGTFTEAAFKDTLRKNPFASHFTNVDFRAIEKQFWNYVWDRWEGETGPADSDRSALEALLARGAGAVKEAPVAPVKTATLLDTPEDTEAQLVIAMASVLAGDPESALERLDAAHEVQPDKAKRARLDTERTRVKAWIATRDEYFQHLLKSQVKLSLKLGGKKLLASVANIEDGQLILAKNNRGMNALPIKGLSPVELAALMNGSKSTFAGGWAVAYPGAMDPGTRRKRWLTGDEPELKKLAADVKGDYKNRRREIEAAQHLVELSLDPLIHLYEKGDLTRLQHLEELWKSRDEVSWVAELESVLPGHAASLLGKQFDDKPIADHLTVPFHPDSDGMVELVYDFSDPAQLKDWRLDPDTMHDRGRWESTDIAEPFLHIEDGMMKGEGATARTHKLSLSGVQSIQWKQTIHSGGKASSSNNATLRVAICADDDGGYAALYHNMDIEVMEGLSYDYTYESATEYRNRFDREYARELQYDGKEKVIGLSEGKEVASSASGNRSEGRAQIFLHTDYLVEVKQIVIRGQLTGNSFDVMRTAWIEDGLKVLGLQR